MLLVRLLFILGSFIFAAAVQAAELDLSMTGSAGYDDNVFRTNRDKKDDASFRFGPTIRVRNADRTLSYNISYNPVYEKFVTYDEADDWSHFAAAAAEYQLNDQTVFNFLDQFRAAQSMNRGALIPEQDVTGEDIQDVPDSEVRREDVYRNHAVLSMTHNFGPRTVGSVAVVHDYFNSDRRNTSENFSLATTGNLDYAITARDRLGGGAGFTWQKYEGVRGQPESDSFIYRLFASWLHNFGDDTELKIQVGPALIYTDQNKANVSMVNVYPHFEVTEDMTIAQAYDRLGLNVPGDVQDLDGTPLMGTDDIRTGSVLVPGSADCLKGSVVDSSGVQQTVFSNSNCGFNVVINNDGSGPSTLPDTYQATADAIIAANKTTPSFLDGSDGSSSDTRLTVFGEVSLTHHWLPELTSSVSYSRSDYSASSLGASTIADRVTVLNVWTPVRRWDFRVRGDWLQRKSSNEISQTFQVIAPADPASELPPATSIIESTDLISSKFDESIDTTYWSVSGRAAYRVSRRGTVSLRATYQHQDTDRAASTTNSTFKNVRVILGFRYDLDPFHF
jgi:hypothetical protein